MCKIIPFITCDNYHCIYENGGVCRPSSIVLDHMGICNSGINAMLEGEALEQEKVALLKELNPDMV